MAVGKSKFRSALGDNPLSHGIFSKTSELDTPRQEEENQESRILNQESSFLSDTGKEKVNLRLPIEINDWLDELIKKGKRNHGHKIPKETWVQAALELFRALPVDWERVESVERLKEEIKNLESRIKKM